MSLSHGLTFTLSSENNKKFGARTGTLSLNQISLSTPGLLTSTSRGVIPHLSRDHYAQIDGWVNIPFETFLEHSPPLPALPASGSLHSFLGFSPSQHLLSLSARDPNDDRDMPPNGKTELKIMTLRGVRKVSPKEWTAYARSCGPHVVFALADTPFTRKDAPYSQKRMTKSLDRSAAWLIELLSFLRATTDTMGQGERSVPAIFLHLPGLATPLARSYFSHTLTEKLYDKEAKLLAPLRTLDEGVDGYSVDLVPIRLALDALNEKEKKSSSSVVDSQTEDSPFSIPSLLKTSLEGLPSTKPRLVTGTSSPHEILRLVRDIGVDVVDSSYLVSKLAGWGVGLEVEFPVRVSALEEEKRQGKKKRQIGINIYDERYRTDFTSIASSVFRGALEGAREEEETERRPICLCLACSPRSPGPGVVIRHGAEPSLVADGNGEGQGRLKAPFTRAYMHHLLHTHEMSAHTLLTLHNHAVLNSFMAGVRKVVLSKGGVEGFGKEVERFEETYDEEMGVVREASERWEGVEWARGRGRLRREKEKDGKVGGRESGSALTPPVGDVPLKADGGGEIVEEVMGEESGAVVEGKAERVRGEGAVDL